MRLKRPLPGRVAFDRRVDAMDECDVDRGGDDRVAAARAAPKDHEDRQRRIENAVSNAGDLDRQTAPGAFRADATHRRTPATSAVMRDRKTLCLTFTQGLMTTCPSPKTNTLMATGE